MATKTPVRPALPNTQLAGVTSLLHGGVVADARDGGFGGARMVTRA